MCPFDQRVHVAVATATSMRTLPLLQHFAYRELVQIERIVVVEMEHHISEVGSEWSSQFHGRGR